VSSPPHEPLGGGEGGAAAAGESPAKKLRASPEKQSLVPLTVFQILSARLAPDETFRLQNAFDASREIALHHITFVGMIMEVVEATTNVSYMVDDGTGRIEVKVFVSNQEQGYLERKKHEWREGVYVRVYGQLRTWMERSHVMAFRVQRITDFNEITYHGLSVIHSLLGKPPAPAGPASAAAAAAMPPAYGGGAPAAAAASVAAAVGYGGGAAAEAAAAPVGGVTHAVLNVITTMGRTPAYARAGPSRRDIIASLSRDYSPDAVNGAIQMLLSDGLVYGTTDEDHFKAVDST